MLSKNESRIIVVHTQKMALISEEIIMNSISIHLENDPILVANELLELTFSKDTRGDVCVSIQYERLSELCIQSDFYISPEHLKDLPKMLRLLADFIDDKKVD